MRSIIATLTCAVVVTAAVPASAQPIDQLPMYGGMDRAANPSLKAADDKLIADTSRYYGSREKASAAFADNGFAYYGRDDLAKAMQRFNQAWLLDPANPQAWWGFAVVLADKGMHCDSMHMFEKALSLGHYIEGMNPDAARITVLCAVNDKALSNEEKEALFRRADSLYAEALDKDPNKGYVYASKATAYFWRGQYAEAWAAVKLARSNGGKLPEKFLGMLGEKMPEPST